MQEGNYNYIFQELINLSAKRAKLICGGNDDTKEAAKLYDEKINTIVNGLSLEELKNVVAVANVGFEYIHCVFPDEYYKTNSVGKIYTMETKSDYYTNRGYYSDLNRAREFYCKRIMESRLLHDEILTGLKILGFI